jgi:hypothetical protein
MGSIPISSSRRPCPDATREYRSAGAPRAESEVVHQTGRPEPTGRPITNRSNCQE